MTKDNLVKKYGYIASSIKLIKYFRYLFVYLMSPYDERKKICHDSLLDFQLTHGIFK